MKISVKYLIKPEHYGLLCNFADRNSTLAKNLYNAALFRIRQVFTGWAKDSLNANEREVFAELGATQKKYPSMKIRRRLTYKVLDRMMRVNDNPDFFAGLPMQT